MKLLLDNLPYVAKSFSIKLATTSCELLQQWSIVIIKLALACVSLVNLYTWSIILPGKPNLLLGYQEVILIKTFICLFSIRNWDITTITVKFKYRYWVFMNWWSALFVLNSSFCQVNDRLYRNVVNLWQATTTN